MSSDQPPVQSVLTIGGSDSSGGAGVQADLKTFNNLGLHGSSVLTCVTAQNSLGVSHVEAISCASIRHQLDAVLTDLSLGAVKTGMLFSAEIVEEISDTLNNFDASIVVDPVMVSRAGSILLHDDAVASYKKLLFPLASLITPNIFEAGLLANCSISTKSDVEVAASRLLDYGVGSVLVKGGGRRNFAGQDYLLTNQGCGKWYVSEYLDTPHTHGTGCTLSAAVAAFLTTGLTLSDAIHQSKRYLNKALQQAFKFGKSTGCVCHFASIQNQFSMQN